MFVFRNSCTFVSSFMLNVIFIFKESDLVFLLVCATLVAPLPNGLSRSWLLTVFTIPSLLAKPASLQKLKVEHFVWGEQKWGKEKKNTDVKVLLAWRAVVYSFLNLNYLEQKHCCLKSAFSGAYFSRLPLTQDWLPFFRAFMPLQRPPTL